jgi:hypothetical protein
MSRVGDAIRRLYISKGIITETAESLKPRRPGQMKRNARRSALRDARHVAERTIKYGTSESRITLPENPAGEIRAE